MGVLWIDKNGSKDSRGRWIWGLPYTHLHGRRWDLGPIALEWTRGGERQ